ncbi:MAG: phosphoribosylformylglycinamidine cyclo-ligase [candidate division WOR-3 bacterium]|nr:MAG: phosphoribosylformylglycinamidine cyclo-ligase [candidate division WOR-3 bacterium]
MLYKNAGVDIDFLNLIRKGIGRHATKTFSARKRSEFGLFGGIFSMGPDILISSCDSVGTKILVACATGVHHTVGADLVNHCVNDILTTGALPLFFMDYIGFSKVRGKVIVDVVRGLARACRNEKMALVGGETAQLTRFYPDGVYDLVGFIVGMVNKKNYIDPTARIKRGNVIIGLKSSGLHTNGYSLARRVLLRKYRLSSYIPELRCSLAQELLKIHRSYRKDLEPRLRYVQGLAHITGGGFYDNIKRILPRNSSALIRKKAWRPLPIFNLIQKLGKVPDDEMYRVFNMGIGMCVVVDAKHLRYFRALRPKIIGEIVKGDFGVKLE